MKRAAKHKQKQNISCLLSFRGDTPSNLQKLYAKWGSGHGRSGLRAPKRPKKRRASRAGLLHFPMIPGASATQIPQRFPPARFVLRKEGFFVKSGWTRKKPFRSENIFPFKTVVLDPPQHLNFPARFARRIASSS